MPLANIEKAFIDNLAHQQMNESEFLSVLLPIGSLSEKKQLSIYRSNVNGAHQKVLGQIYPACLNILGEDYFNQLCRAYRFVYPSTDPDMNKYGKYFSIFIKKQSEVHNELNDFKYLVDLSWLEWCWHSSYFAKDDTAFSFEQLALIKAEDQSKLFFNLSYSFSLHATAYPLLEIWNANKNTAADEQEFSMPETENYFCISRDDFTPVVNVLNCQQYSLLKLISENLSLTQLTAVDVKLVADFQKQLMDFIEKGWISGFSVNN